MLNGPFAEKKMCVGVKSYDDVGASALNGFAAPLVDALHHV